MVCLDFKQRFLRYQKKLSFSIKILLKVNISISVELCEYQQIPIQTNYSNTTNMTEQNTAYSAEKKGTLEFRAIKNDGKEKSFIALANFQQVVHLALPSMHKPYIAKTVFDPTHTSLVMIEKKKARIHGKYHETEKVIGGICYRPWENRKFVEMVYLIVDEDHRGGGYGAHLVNHFKDEIKSSFNEEVMDILAYADLTAVGFFKKQGFTRDVTLDKKLWVGVIKDYIQSGLMQCTMLEKIRYVESARMILKQKETLLAKLAHADRSDIVHPPPAQWSQGIVYPILPHTIKGIKESGWSPEMDAYARESGSRPYSTPLHDFLAHLKRGKQVHPFLEPVDENDVPDYYKVIENPMDLQTMGTKLKEGQYDSPKAFVEDVKLIISNCRQYNRPTTQFYKAAGTLERSMLAFIKDMPEWSLEELLE